MSSGQKTKDSIPHRVAYAARAAPAFPFVGIASLLIPNSLGQHLEFKEGEGPILKPITNLEDFKLLKKIDQIHTILSPVYDAVSNIKSKLENNITFIGFAGSPWTVSTYMIEGKGSKDHIKTKAFMLNFPDVFDQLILKIQVLQQILIDKILTIIK